MSRIDWGAPGSRVFEAGVDRGVLYVEGGSGVPWNGLVSVTESPTGGEAKAYYLDGVKYLNRVGQEEFAATLEAYTYPDEFALYDGTEEINNGLHVSQQRRKEFSLSYRTLVGNDVDGKDFAYKIHLIYDALASPSQRSNTTLADTLDPFNFSWEISTSAPAVSGHKATSHFVIDSRKTPTELLGNIEDVLYGSATTTARIPSIHELLFIFGSFQSSIFDAGVVPEAYYRTFDAAVVPTAYTSLIDGGSV